ncbi:hypothetical protein [Streptosporangium sp. NPDC000396]|uniref:hypothetical protein n=1 Tax=Streptosporangium sp. NPDC000396 TaxID=3366185 RepID=UPI003690F5AB
MIQKLRRLCAFAAAFAVAAIAIPATAAHADATGGCTTYYRTVDQVYMEIGSCISNVNGELRPDTWVRFQYQGSAPSVPPPCWLNIHLYRNNDPLPGSGSSCTSYIPGNGSMGPWVNVKGSSYIDPYWWPVTYRTGVVVNINNGHATDMLWSPWQEA